MASYIEGESLSTGFTSIERLV